MLASEYNLYLPVPWETRASSLNPALIQPPATDSDDEPWRPPGEMRLGLIGGVHPRRTKRRWILTARGGGTTVISREARLHPFTRAEMGTAFDAARELHADYDDRWIFFIARVVVEGDWDDPAAVTPVWLVEGLSEPEAVMLHFEWESQSIGVEAQPPSRPRGFSERRRHNASHLPALRTAGSYLRPLARAHR